MLVNLHFFYFKLYLSGQKWKGDMMEKVNYDYSKLRGRIVEKKGNIKKFSNELGVSETSLSNKLNNKTSFTQDEILDSIFILDIDSNKIKDYFFSIVSG